MRRLPYILILAAIVLVAMTVFRLSYQYFQSAEIVRAQGRLSLYQASVTAEFERFSHLTYVLAQDPHVIAAATGDDTATVNRRFAGFADKAGLDAIYLMGTDGFTIAASNHATAVSFIGQNYAFRPYFRDALTGSQGQFYAIGTTTGLPGYFIADPVRNGAGTIVGVVAIKIEFDGLEGSWHSSGEDVFLANADGVVLLASNPGWRYRTLHPLDETQRQRIGLARQFPGQELAPLDWQSHAAGWARITGKDRIHLTASALPHHWQLHYFASDDRAVARSWLVSALFVFAAGLIVILVQIQRARRVGAALAKSEREEAQLRQANERLAREIEDRRTAERRLQRTQGELERASRLAALGRLAASVTHELGQPIAAMRNHLAAAEIAATAPAPLLRGVGALVDRMEGITRQLKFFARSDSQEFTTLDLRDTLQVALQLVEPNIAEHGVDIQQDLPQAPATIRGSRLRIEQVLTNILRNAIDASEDRDPPRVSMRIHHGETEVCVEVRDNGHGLGQATLEDLQEPFVTTRESGRGMGLGLAISAGIVKDHEGRLSAENLPEGGALFRVCFPRAEEEPPHV